jgi:V/A-type H+/Na+-transporting ATPase subunit D
MARVKLTKNELKREKDALKRFERYLPTLQLKKQQLQMVIRQVEAKILEKERALKTVRREIMSWVEVFGEDVDLEGHLRISALNTSTGNIAGIDIPVFESIQFETEPYDLYVYPLWVDKGISALKKMLELDAEVRILREQERLLSEELRITTQRVNLFEKVKIPETKENIRMIRIYLGDQQTAAVVRGKIAKAAIDAVAEEASA